MPTVFNNTVLDKIVFNNVELDALVFNNTTVWENYGKPVLTFVADKNGDHNDFTYTIPANYRNGFLVAITQGGSIFATAVYNGDRARVRKSFHTPYNTEVDRWDLGAVTKGSTVTVNRISGGKARFFFVGCNSVLGEYAGNEGGSFGLPSGTTSIICFNPSGGNGFAGMNAFDFSASRVVDYDYYLDGWSRASQFSNFSGVSSSSWFQNSPTPMNYSMCVN